MAPASTVLATAARSALGWTAGVPFAVVYGSGLFVAAGVPLGGGDSRRAVCCKAGVGGGGARRLPARRVRAAVQPMT